MIDHDKTLVCVSDNIDLSNWVGRLVANVIAGVAEGELEALRERQVGSRRKLRELGRWAGGKPPFGYTAVERVDGKGKSLEVDELAESVVRRIVDDVLDGKQLTRIARELNAEGYLVPGAVLRDGSPWVSDRAVAV